MITVFVILFIIILFLWLGSKSEIKKITGQFKSEKESLSKELAFAQQRILELAKYQTIIDIEKEVDIIRNNAENSAADLLLRAQDEAATYIAQGKNEMDLSKNEAKAIRAEAKSIKEVANTQANLTKIKAERVLQEAESKAMDMVKEAQSIIDDAHKKAIEIGGDAYTALQNADYWGKTAKAMKNIIEGYGDRYLKPTYSLLDDLSEEFGHTEAGEKLKSARKRTELMVENRMAATCEYVEANRKETAIQFVLDAFNGKVDSILSKVKKDNYGTLEQMILDAFQLVNSNGRAFRNAVITDAYLKTRLEELHWAAITQELKWQEQEEQRRIKEQIREEEKAKKDFERAMKEAQKEEETLKRLIESAQEQVSKSNEAQKAAFALKLQELEGKLKEAEEKNQRALSMAQQTRSGNVYIISNIGSFGEDIYKIGMTRRLEPLDRIRELGDASVPFEFDVHAMIYCEDAPSLERELHKKFLRLQLNKVNPKKEFFKVNLTSIKDEIESMGIEAKWTMTSEARQYKETLAIEEAILRDTNVAKQWEAAQMEVNPVTEAELAIEEI